MTALRGAGRARPPHTTEAASPASPRPGSARLRASRVLTVLATLAVALLTLAPTAAALGSVDAPVDLAAARGGYYLVDAAGRVAAHDGAPFHGSLEPVPGAAPVVAMTVTPGGSGYWLLGADGEVYAFGAAPYRGSLAHVAHPGRPVDVAATPTGAGYWIVTDTGGVFAFGDAVFLGPDGSDPLPAPVVGLEPTETGLGYRLRTVDGGTVDFGDAAPPPLGSGSVPDAEADAAAGGRVDPNHPFLVCTRAHESDGAGGYRAVNPSGTYRGAYQFSRATWDATARHAGRPDLVGVDPAAAAPADQDFLALHLYRWQGAAPWGGRCAGR